MHETQTFIKEVGEQDFQPAVMRRSLDVPVVANFYSPRFPECAAVTASLKTLAKEFAGRFELANVNIDEAQQLATMFRLQTVPTVFLFKDGNPVDGGPGAMSEVALRALIERHVPPPVADPLEAAQEAMSAGDLMGAERAYQSVIRERPDNAEARLGLARVALSTGRLDEAAGQLDAIQKDSPFITQAERLRGMFAFSADAGDVADLQSKVEARPDDVEAWYQLGATLSLSGGIEDAVRAFLKVVELDRTFRDDAGRVALLSLFDLLGSEDPLVLKYRRRLAALLF